MTIRVTANKTNTNRIQPARIILQFGIRGGIEYSDMTAKQAIVKWFDCPHCKKQTSHQMPLGIRLTWVRCESCGKEFVVENDKPSKPSP